MRLCMLRSPPPLLVASHLTQNNIQARTRAYNVQHDWGCHCPSNFISSSSCPSLCGSRRSSVMTCSGPCLFWRDPFTCRRHTPGDTRKPRLPQAHCSTLWLGMDSVEVLLILLCIFLFLLYLLLLYVWRREVYLHGDIKKKRP